MYSKRKVLSIFDSIWKKLNKLENKQYGFKVDFRPFGLFDWPIVSVAGSGGGYHCGESEDARRFSVLRAEACGQERQAVQLP